MSARRCTCYGVALGCALAACGSGEGQPDAGPPDVRGLPTDEGYPPGAPFVGWFRDATDESGVNVVGVALGNGAPGELRSNGVATGDLDGDGLPELVFTRGFGAPAVYRNDGGLRFTDVTATWGFAGAPDALGAALADLDGDGDLEVLLAGDAGLRLYRNRGGGAFADETAAAGLAIAAQAMGATPVDADNDGLTDLFVLHYAPPSGAPDARDRLFRNRGDGTFEESAAGALANTGASWAVAAFDYDADGDQDLYVANDAFIHDSGSPSGQVPQPGAQPDFLYRNEGVDAAGTLSLVEVAAAEGLGGFRSSMGAITQDLDGDGVVDLYVSDFGKNNLFLGGVTFADGTDQLGLGAPARIDRDCPAGGEEIFCLLVSWGAAREDFDHDGLEDLLILHSQVGGGDTRQPTAAWRGVARGVYAPIHTTLGWLSGRALLTPDLDGDGDLDLVLTTYEGPAMLFENLAGSASGHWLRVRLRGRAGNPEGLGARLRVTLAAGAMERTIGAGGVMLSWGPAEAHFGLGSEVPTTLQVVWPSGFVQDVALAGIDRVIDVEEPLGVALSARVVPADGVSTAVVTVAPAATDGTPLGPGHAVSIDATAGGWGGPVADLGDGTYRRSLVAAATPRRAVVTIVVDGATLALRPIVEFR